MKFIYSILFCFPLILIAQLPIEQQLDSINTSEDATIFLKNNGAKKDEIVSFNKVKHKSRVANDLFELPKGGKKIYRNNESITYYKVIEKEMVLHYRVSVIVLDGKDLTMEQINEKRSKIISQFNEGYKFKDLAKHYSMENTSRTGGDLGWMRHGEMFSEFEDAVFNGIRAVNSIFTVDVPNYQKYYVVLKTHENTEIEVIDVLKLTETSR